MFEHLEYWSVSKKLSIDIVPFKDWVLRARVHIQSVPILIVAALWFALAPRLPLLVFMFVGWGARGKVSSLGGK